MAIERDIKRPRWADVEDDADVWGESPEPRDVVENENNKKIENIDSMSIIENIGIMPREIENIESTGIFENIGINPCPLMDSGQTEKVINGAPAACRFRWASGGGSVAFKFNRVGIKRLATMTTFVVPVAGTETLGWLRKAIEAKLHIPAADQMLTLFQSKLEGDHKQLNTCNIKDGCCLYVSDKRTVEIFVSTLIKGIVSLKVPPSTPVEVFKQMISSRTGLPPQDMWLTWSKYLIQSDRVLSDYAIREGDTVRVHLRLAGGRIHPADVIATTNDPSLARAAQAWNVDDAQHLEALEEQAATQQVQET